MSRDWMADWRDNPIFIKHLRSRLRRQPLISSIVITLVLCLCIAWGGYQLDSFLNGGAFGTLLALQAIILAIMGASQVGSSVSSARASGILDFHRVSPLTPTELTLGFFFGAPIREYLLFACTLPFSFLCLAMGTPDFRGFLQLMIVLVTTSWVLHGLALVNALIMKKQAGRGGVVGLVIFLAIMSGSFISGFGRVASIVDREPRLSFFGISLPWLAVVLLYQAPILFFIYLASRRKIDSERLHPFSKPQAVAAMATLGVLLTGGIWDVVADYEPLAIVILYVLVAVALILTAMVTPTQAEYYKGLWRALKQNRPRLSLWDDLALNRLFLGVVCAIVLVTATIAWNRFAGQSSIMPRPLREGYPLAIANGVLVVAYFGLAHQFFQIRFGRRGASIFALFLFLTWVVPLLVGTITLFANYMNPAPSQIVYALSPIAGLGLSAGGGNTESLMAIEAAAITPSLLYTFVFNVLLGSARKPRWESRTDRAREDQAARRGAGRVTLRSVRTRPAPQCPPPLPPLCKGGGKFARGADGVTLETVTGPS